MFPAWAGPMAISDRIKHFFQKKNSFVILIRPEPPPKPSYVLKKHPQTIKKNDDFFQEIQNFDIDLYLDLLGPGFDHLEW